jgi:hypothetical protein
MRKLNDVGDAHGCAFCGAAPSRGPALFDLVQQEGPAHTRIVIRWRAQCVRGRRNFPGKEPI